MHTNLKRISLAAIATAAVFGVGAQAEEELDEVAALTEPESVLRIGAGYVTRDNQHFGIYNGLNEKGGYLLLDADIVSRDDDTGTWRRLIGRNLGLDTRELRYEHSRQGDWGYFLDYNQIPRVTPFTINTGLSGIGSADLVVNGEPARDVELKTERERLTLGLDKRLQSRVSFHLRATTEDKDGARLFGRGTTGAAGFQFLAEPIHQTTRQVEAIVNYTGEKLQLSGGYYGTMFNNKNPALNITEAGPPTGLAGFTPMGLPPDNQAHQLSLAGGYSFAPTTRGTFKVALARLTQDDTFIVPAANGRTDLGGRVDTTALQAGISSRPTADLSLLANLRYEDRDDKTPVVNYFPTLVVTTATGENEPRSITTTTGKLEASYRLPAAFRLTAGVEEEIKKRNTSSVRVVSFREKTEETSYRLELRRSMSETITGAVAYIRSDRGGSEFQTTTLTTGATGSNLIAPLHLADRERDKVRLSLNWTPTEPLSVQLIADRSRDDYDGRSPLGLGLRSGRAEFFSIDAGYVFSEAWQANIWYSRNDNRIDQATCVSASGDGVCPASLTQPVWGANLRNVGDAIGLGLQGRPSERFSLGLDVQYSTIRDEFVQFAIEPANASVAPLPDINTIISTARIYGRYELTRNSALRLDYVYDRFRTDDWTWTAFTYNDGTQVIQNPKEIVRFIGLSYYHRWQ